MTKTDFVKRTGIAVRTAERLLPELESSGIFVVAEKGAGRRSTVYVFNRLLAITEKAGV